MVGYMISRKTKIIILSIGIVCVLGISVWGVNSTYSNYQKSKAEQAKEQHKNEQISEATEKIKKIVDDKISNLDCKTEYNCGQFSDDNLVITIRLNGMKDKSMDCKFKITNDSVDFYDYNSFVKNFNELESQEEIAEIRNRVIDDYQDMMFRMKETYKEWDDVDFSTNNDDYVVQETSDRFFGGDKAYLITIDSKWTAKSGHTEWKHICLHMEYDKNNKFIDAKYGDYDKIDPDKDIKNGTKVVNESTIVSTASSNSSQISSNSSIRQKRLEANWVDNANKSDLYNDYAYELESLEGGTQNLIGMDKSNIKICYDKYNDYINRLWKDLENKYSKEEFQKIIKDENDWIKKKTNKYPTCDSENGTFNDKYGAIQMTDERIGELLKYLN